MEKTKQKESCKKAGKLFNNETDVSSGDTISRAKVLALINKAMYNTDNKEIQDYLFCGLRRDVHNLPTIEPSGNLVSRQDAIKVGNKIIEELSLSSIDWDDLKCWAKELFDELPSADRPKCEDCEYRMMWKERADDE